MIIRTLLLLLIVAATAAAQPRWEFLETWGSSTFDIFTMTDGTLLASTWSGTFNSSNGGEEWRQINKPAPSGAIPIAVSPRTGTVIAHSYQKLYFSIDGGSKWETARVDLPVSYSFLISVARDGIFYVATENQNDDVAGVLRSDDDGRTWRRVGLHGINSDAILALDDGTVVVATNASGGRGRRELRVSTDHGVSWSAGRDFPWTGRRRFEEVRDLDLDSMGVLWARTPIDLWSSIDQGLNWTLRLKDSASHLFGMAVAPDGELLVPTGDAGIWRSNNHGNSWSHLALDRVQVGNGEGVIALPAGDLFLLNNTGIFHSTDNGVTWSRRNNGIPPQVLTLGAAQGRLVARSFDEIRISNDGGKTWRFHPPLRIGSRWGGISDRGILLIASDSALERSVDGGLTWTMKEVDFFIRGFADNGAGDLFGFAWKSYGSCYLCISHNDGITWECPTFRLGLNSIKPIAFDGRDAAYIAGGTGIAVSRDNGATWSLRYPSPASAVTVHQKGSAIAMTDSGVVRSDDRGETWSVVADTTLRFTCFVTAPDRSIIGGTTEQGIWRSINGGQDWTHFSEGLTDEHITTLAVDRSTGVVYAGTEHSGLFRLVWE